MIVRRARLVTLALIAGILFFPPLAHAYAQGSRFSLGVSGKYGSIILPDSLGQSPNRFVGSGGRAEIRLIIPSSTIEDTSIDPHLFLGVFKGSTKNEKASLTSYGGGVDLRMGPIFLGPELYLASGDTSDELGYTNTVTYIGYGAKAGVRILFSKKSFSSFLTIGARVGTGESSLDLTNGGTRNINHTTVMGFIGVNIGIQDFL